MCCKKWKELVAENIYEVATILLVKVEKSNMAVVAMPVVDMKV